MNLAWNTLEEFIAMGGYGLYVWGSFGVCAAAIAAEVALLRARSKALKQTQRRGRTASRFSESPHEAQG
jgi:heme exporter protein D